MQKINKFVVGFTLFLFMGQSFAALKMSCEIPDNLSHNSGSELTVHHIEHLNSQMVHSDAHQQHTGVPAEGVLAENVSFTSACGADQHACYCSTGTCSTFFLPVTNQITINNSVPARNCATCSYYNYQSSSLFRPPISV
jgi:hypothetical protein